MRWLIMLKNWLVNFSKVGIRIKKISTLIHTNDKEFKRLHTSFSNQKNKEDLRYNTMLEKLSTVSTGFNDLRSLVEEQNLTIEELKGEVEFYRSKNTQHNIDDLSVKKFYLLDLVPAKNIKITQSSFNRARIDPLLAVNSTYCNSYAIHTKLEDNPWWQLDVGYVIHAKLIYIYNRVDVRKERAKNLVVMVSNDGMGWTHLAAKWDESLSVMKVNVNGFRYLKISLPGTEYLHLSKVKIIFSEEMSLFLSFLLSRGFNVEHLHEMYAGLQESKTEFLKGLSRKNHIPNVLHINNKFGRSGNNLLQLTNAFTIADHLNIKLVVIPKISLLKSDSLDMLINGVRVMTEDIYFEKNLDENAGLVIEGKFFYKKFLNIYKYFDNVQRNKDEIYELYVRPLIWEPVTVAGDYGYDSIAIHIRGGDVFDEQQAHPVYVQPPLNYYIKNLEEIWSENGTLPVTIVSEDRLNPCVDLLINYLMDKKIRHRFQSSNLLEDISSLTNKKFLIFGFGTFSLIPLRMSTKLDTVYSFRHAMKIDLVNQYNVYDTLDDYIGPNRWTASNEQKCLMIDYPSSKIVKMESYFEQ